jgi:hypothetical protein
MNKQTTPSALTEEVSKNNDPKQVKAKQIFLGIDAHLARNQVARKKDNSGIQGVQSLSLMKPVARRASEGEFQIGLIAENC